MSFIKSLLSPLMPPKDFSVNDRNFELEYAEMKQQYLQKMGKSEIAAKQDEQYMLPLRSTLRH